MPRLRMEPILTIRPWSGQRGFGRTMPRAEIEAQLVEFYPTLISVPPYGVETAPLGVNLVGSLGYTQRPQLRFRLRHQPLGYWYRLDDEDVLIGMPALLFWDVNRQFTQPGGGGVIGQVTMTDEEVELVIGEFIRDDGVVR